jgi:hypothetical protein
VVDMVDDVERDESSETSETLGVAGADRMTSRVKVALPGIIMVRS